ncbi:hypothetical protein P7C73_g5094, partial [Tremellales sp. Uapishka_1]
MISHPGYIVERLPSTTSDVMVSSENDDRQEPGQLTLGEIPGSTHFFGNAGAAYLMPREASPPRSVSPNPGFAGNESSMMNSFPFGSAATSIDVLKTHLPSREEAERLIRIFYEDGTAMSDIVNPAILATTMKYVYSSSAAFNHEIVGQKRINNQHLAGKFMVFAIASAMDQARSPFESELPEMLLCDSSYQGSGHRRSWFQRLYMKMLINEGYVEYLFCAYFSLLFLHRSLFAHALRDHQQEPLRSLFSYVSELESSRVMIALLRDCLASYPASASRNWSVFFHAVTAIVNFAVTVIRSPTSSLARAAFSQVEDGVGLFEAVQENAITRQVLPFLRRLLYREWNIWFGAEHRKGARESAVLSIPSPDLSTDSLPILGIGTTLRRVPYEPISNARNATRPERSRTMQYPVGVSLPTTLADAAASQELSFDYLGSTQLPTTDMNANPPGFLWNDDFRTGGYANPSFASEDATDFDLDAFIAGLGEPLEEPLL